MEREYDLGYISGYDVGLSLKMTKIEGTFQNFNWMFSWRKFSQEIKNDLKNTKKYYLSSGFYHFL